MAASGDFQWPPMGRFSWPPSIAKEAAALSSFEARERID
jgi:hypothetical protein